MLNKISSQNEQSEPSDSLESYSDSLEEVDEEVSLSEELAQQQQERRYYRR